MPGGSERGEYVVPMTRKVTPTSYAQPTTDIPLTSHAHVPLIPSNDPPAPNIPPALNNPSTPNTSITPNVPLSTSVSPLPKHLLADSTPVAKDLPAREPEQPLETNPTTPPVRRSMRERTERKFYNPQDGTYGPANS